MKFILVILSLAFAIATTDARAAKNGPLAPEMAEAMSKQINSELSAAYIYLAISSHFRNQNLNGFGHWFAVHFYEEVEHARKMLRFLNDKGAPVTFPAIQEVKAVIESPAHAFEQALHREVEQTAKIHAIYEKAKALKSYETEVFLQYFVEEQVEEEAIFTEYWEKLKLVEKSPEGLLALDRELGARPFPKIE